MQTEQILLIAQMTTQLASMAVEVAGLIGKVAEGQDITDAELEAEKAKMDEAVARFKAAAEQAKSKTPAASEPATGGPPAAGG